MSTFSNNQGCFSNVPCSIISPELMVPYDFSLPSKSTQNASILEFVWLLKFRVTFLPPPSDFPKSSQFFESFMETLVYLTTVLQLIPAVSHAEIQFAKPLPPIHDCTPYGVTLPLGV